MSRYSLRQRLDAELAINQYPNQWLMDLRVYMTAGLDTFESEYASVIIFK